MKKQQPSVTLVAAPSISVDAVNEWLDSRDYGTWEPTADNLNALYEAAGRTCYMSFPPKKGRNSIDYIKNLFDSGHASVFNHGMWSFVIDGVSRAFSHEWVRHHVGTAISQLSQRYVDQIETGAVVPPDFEGTELESMYLDFTTQARSWYNLLLQKAEETLERHENESKRDFLKRIRQSARYILPEGTETVLFWSANTTELRHIFLMRCSAHADVEMRTVANLLFDVCVENSPLAFYGLVKEELADGTFQVTEAQDAENVV